MNNLIYYPTFEPQNLKWLKYALICIDNFSPIIPYKGRQKLSPVFRTIEDETDLIKAIEPTWQQGVNVAVKAWKEIRYIRRYPNYFTSFFGSENIYNEWCNQNNWKFKLYEEKFSIPFKESCIQQGLAKECEGGMLLSESLGSFYMTFLAEEIAFQHSASPITDNIALDSFSTYLRARNPKNHSMLKAAISVVEQKIPQDLESIDIYKIIKFRNDTGITELRRDFNRSLRKFYESVEQNFDPYSFIETIRKTNIELIKEITMFFGGVAVTTVGALIILNDENSSNLENLKQSIEGTIIGLGGTIGINKAWQLNSERRNARKYLSNLKNIS